MLTVIAYPRLADRDMAAIQHIRMAHDPQFKLVPPHFTLVFGQDALTAAKLSDHVRQTAGSFPPFSIDLRRAQPIYDNLSGKTYLFLVVDEGNSHLLRLHDTLYTGPLAPHLRYDPPYIPHITLGIFDAPEAAARLAGTLNARELEITGWVDELAISQVREDRAYVLERIRLG